MKILSGAERTTMCSNVVALHQRRESGSTRALVVPTTVELHSSRLIGPANYPDVQKIRIIGFFLNRLHWQFEVEKKTTNGHFRLHIYLRTNKILIHNSLYVFGNWEKKLGHKKRQYNYAKKMFTRKAKPIRTMSVRISGVLLSFFFVACCCLTL